MTAEEMRELDAWIAEHVMEFSNYACLLEAWRPTKRPQDAMDVLKKCADKTMNVRISRFQNWVVACNDLIDLAKATERGVAAETLELAICLFAKQLFSQPTTK